MLLIFIFLQIFLTDLHNAFCPDLGTVFWTRARRAPALARLRGASRILTAARMNCLLARAIKEIVGALGHEHLMTYVAGG